MEFVVKLGILVPENYLFILWSRVLEKLRIPQLVKAFPLVFYPKFHYRVHNSPPLSPVLRKINLCHILPHYLFNIHFNITLPSTSSICLS
jgi:hypothetical protein